jgi:hypothetical protein
MEENLPPDQQDEELARVRTTLASRYDDLKSGTVSPISGDELITRMRSKSAARRTSHS